MDARQTIRPDRERMETLWRELVGVVERITYQHPETGFTVARLLPERESDAAGRDDERLVTVVGSLPNLQPGEAIRARGWWKQDPTHGWQFQAIEYRTTLPATVQGMKRYLGSGLVKGIGPVTAGRLVDAFGEATFTVIDEQVERLTEVPGIGPVRAARIAATWDEQRHIREVMAALQGYGVSTSLAVRIYQRFRDDSARVITQEPYRLAREVWGIGFATADTIAQAVGIAPDAPARLPLVVRTLASRRYVSRRDQYRVLTIPGNRTLWLPESFGSKSRADAESCVSGVAPPNGLYRFMRDAVLCSK